MMAMIIMMTGTLPLIILLLIINDDDGIKDNDHGAHGDNDDCAQFRRHLRSLLYDLLPDQVIVHWLSTALHLASLSEHLEPDTEIDIQTNAN